MLGDVEAKEPPRPLLLPEGRRQGSERNVVTVYTTATRGSPPQFFPHYPDLVPEELKEGDFWVCCNSEKAPLVANVSGRKRYASSTNPETWASYPRGLEAFETGRYAGVGRVITDDDPYIGVDLDGVRDPLTGSLSSWAREVLRLLDSYSEVSPSGTGVKVWLKGSGLKHSMVKPGLEVYRSGRYFTVTGQMLPQYRE